MSTRRETIMLTVADLVIELLDEGRTDDEELPRGAIEDAIEAGEVTVDDIVAEFKRALTEAVES